MAVGCGVRSSDVHHLEHTSLSQLLKCNLLMLHEAPELARLQAESYVRVSYTLPLEIAHKTALRRRNRFFNWYLKACAAQQ